MRLDKFICDGTALTRSLAKKALRRGDISCDGTGVKDPGSRSQKTHVCASKAKKFLSSGRGI